MFVEDLAAAKRFYSDVFQLPLHFEDDNSAVFKFGDTLVNLLDDEPSVRACRAGPGCDPRRGVSRFQFALGVDDVDATS